MEVFNGKDGLCEEGLGSEGPWDLVRHLSEMILVWFICVQAVEWTKSLHGSSQKDRKMMGNRQ